MLHVCRTEIWKAIHNVGFYLALSVGIILSIGNIIQNAYLAQKYIFEASTITLSNGIEWSTANTIDTSIYYNWLGVNTPNLSNIIFYFAFPLLAALPFGGAMLIERKNGYRNQLLIRIPKQKELLGKYLAGFLSGGTVVSIPLAFDFLINALVLPITHPVVTNSIASIHEPQFGSLLFYRYPILFVMADIGLVFLWGGTIGVLSLAVSTFVHKKISCIVAPLCIFLFIELGYELNMLVTSTEWSPFRLFHLATIRGTSGIIIFGEIILLLLLSFIILIVKGTHNEIL